MGHGGSHKHTNSGCGFTVSWSRHNKSLFRRYLASKGNLFLAFIRYCSSYAVNAILNMPISCFMCSSVIGIAHHSLSFIKCSFAGGLLVLVPHLGLVGYRLEEVIALVS
jgi:hypothetical protein